MSPVAARRSAGARSVRDGNEAFPRRSPTSVTSGNPREKANLASPAGDRTSGKRSSPLLQLWTRGKKRTSRPQSIPESPTSSGTRCSGYTSLRQIPAASTTTGNPREKADFDLTVEGCGAADDKPPAPRWSDTRGAVSDRWRRRPLVPPPVDHRRGRRCHLDNRKRTDEPAPGGRDPGPRLRKRGPIRLQQPSLSSR